MDRIHYQLHLFTGSDLLRIRGELACGKVMWSRESPLWDLPNTIITPHIATESVKLSDAVVDFWCENLRRFAENQPLLGVVDRQEGY